jgi:thiol-disulfide isomerase/thioredoxin
MQEHDNKYIEDNEAKLNPAPKNFRVSYAIKLGFIGITALGIGVYFQSIKTRRDAEKKFLQENHMAETTPTISIMPAIKAMEPKTGQLVDIAEPNSWTLLNIWATWCPPCREEMPSLELLQQKLKNKLHVIALSVDDNIDMVKEFMVINQPSFRVLWDHSKEASLKFGIKKYPETFLINPQGRIVAQFSGPRDWAAARAIDYLLNILK